MDQENGSKIKIQIGDLKTPHHTLSVRVCSMAWGRTARITHELSLSLLVGRAVARSGLQICLEAKHWLPSNMLPTLLKVLPVHWVTLTLLR